MAVPGGLDRRTVQAAKLPHPAQVTSLAVSSSLCAYRLRCLVELSCWHAATGEFIARRCQQLLDDYPTSMEQDAELLQNGACTADMALSVRYRMGKKRTLVNATARMKKVRCPAAAEQ